MKRHTAVLLLVAAMIGVGMVAACRSAAHIATYKGKGRKGGSDTYVYLEMVDGTCVATQGVGTLGGNKGKKITWHLTNNCTTKQYLSFTHYQEVTDFTTNPWTLGAVAHDLIDPDQNKDYYDTKTLDPGDSDKKLDATIIKDNGGGDSDKLFKYTICVGPSPKPTTNCLDPEVDIWP